MTLLRTALVCALLVTLPVSAAESLIGIWKMRAAEPGSKTTQTVTIEPVATGTKFTTVIDFGNGTGMTMAYVIKFDGAEVPVYSAGKEVMKIRGKKTGPNSYEGSTSGPGGTINYKTSISADGKTMTTESTSGSMPGPSVYDRVK